jgi:hypothetical protein
MEKAKEFLTKTKETVLSEENKKKASEVKSTIKKAFNDHPNHAGETYPQHLWFTIKMAVTMFYTSLILLVHGFLPFLFTRTASGNFKKMNQTLQDRVHKVDESIAAEKAI